MPEATDIPKASAGSSAYIGRFAPSPTGPLHMGSLVAALASYLDARRQGGAWLMRMEDLDPPRESREAADLILFALDALGLHWDGPVLYQSTRHDAYREALARLRGQGRLFACDCTRQQVQAFDGVYPGTCRDRHLEHTRGTALRCRVSPQTLRFQDRLQGEVEQQLEWEVGDFVVVRKDGLFAYQLAVVVDDAHQGVNQVVRGIDLLDSTARQIYLQRLLDLPTPQYAHLPVIVDARGQKLSKQQMAAPIDVARPAGLLYRALVHLQQAPDPALADAGPDDVLAWAIAHWQPGNLQGMTSIAENP